MSDARRYAYGRNQGQGHSREVDRQSPTGLIFIIIIIIIIQNNLGELVTECQTILGFTAADDDDDMVVVINWNS